MGPPWRIDATIHRTMSERSYHGATSRSEIVVVQTEYLCERFSRKYSDIRKIMLMGDVCKLSVVPKEGGGGGGGGGRLILGEMKS